MFSGRETIAEHRETAKGFRLSRLVLKNVPVLGELAVFEAHDVSSDPRSRASMAGEASVANNVVPLGEDQVIFVAQRLGQAPNKAEQTIAARRDVSTVLNVTFGPESLRGSIVAFVEQRVEGFENEGSANAALRSVSSSRSRVNR